LLEGIVLGDFALKVCPFEVSLGEFCVDFTFMAILTEPEVTSDDEDFLTRWRAELCATSSASDLEEEHVQTLLVPNDGYTARHIAAQGYSLFSICVVPYSQGGERRMW
jgi:hypothetical protein